MQSMSTITDLEAQGLTPDQIETLERIARKLTVAGLPTDPGDMARFVFGPTKTNIERIKAVTEGMTQPHVIKGAYREYARTLTEEALQNEVGPLPWHIRIWWAILDALDAIRRLLRAVYRNSGEMVDPEFYGGIT
jgi:hypothetical protein